ncbi:alpha/beta hydrolase [Acanthopleuribacter pedis]|uniref:Esterase n=1 Tax=Acanthopleuribacter pedis TaxID=442870 RepID=A0A8J7U5C5_9BACT|nr:alpha/beta hydrolase-fold protein [Acanthopleuribacter pedis]MBO1321587.1 hypothetical protein [Acanthopleuribacter pedis]
MHSSLFRIGFILLLLFAPDALAAKKSKPKTFGELLQVSTQVKPRKAHRLIRKFIKRQGHPLVEKTQAVFLFEHKAGTERPRLLHDNNAFGALYGKDDPAIGQMTRISQTTWYYATVPLLEDARLVYEFAVGEKRLTDPHNPATVQVFGNTLSSFTMPQFKERFSKEEQARTQPGRIETQKIKRNGKEEEIFVYVPRAFDEDRDRAFPVMYINDGSLFLDEGNLKQTLDAMMYHSQCDPFFVVLSNPTNRREEYRGSSKYRNWYVYDLFSFIDRTYNTLDGPEHRVILGGSRGALMALDAMLNYPNRVANVAALTPALSPTKFMRNFKRKSKPGIKVFVGLANLDAYWLKDGRELAKVLRTKRLAHKTAEFQDGHHVHAWVDMVPSAAAYFFPFTPR